MPLRNLYVILTIAVLSLFCYSAVERTRYALPVGNAISLINRYYVDPVDERDLLEGAMQGVVGRLDPYTQYINPESYALFQDALQQQFGGIGIVVDQPEEDGYVRVVTPLLDTPAFRAGLLPNDRIIQVDDSDTTGMKLPEVSEMLRGIEGTSVEIKVRRGQQEPLTFEIERAMIPLESVVGDHRNDDNRWVFKLREHPDIAYIRISTFGEQTVAETTDALKALNNDFDSLIIDLRQNQGGLLSAAVDISDMFLNDGKIVTTRGRGGKEDQKFEARSGTLVSDDKPVVIMVDGDSASASEIVAACLKDHERAVIAGERSFGKGTVQQVLPLESGRSALKLTTARYYRPSGANIHRAEDFTDEDDWGVRPTEGLKVPVDDDQRRILLGRLGRATYPVLPKSPSDAATDDDSEEKPSNAIEVDPQLMRAVEHLLNPVATAEKTAA